ncbi:uncharacterized protein P174DRAFT_154260 [Aspergillus novofumigatus IBT 16806]|uniref:Uncharacterized protein n=1 Tax=Aspergillus novofumigatus (strain IBT 16806) TaxID=1392255 RepID=A0A2I1CEV6_ASPN1|nr:uncharacterized protein P174DRAFT_154260 [Aspergillus novofumigatus IBT 16806]PKX96155.1 hypothetical protein P174DRAFT_154260 [Aspergillus novofumigatus IBT 16806]
MDSYPSGQYPRVLLVSGYSWRNNADEMERLKLQPSPPTARGEASHGCQQGISGGCGGKAENKPNSFPRFSWLHVDISVQRLWQLKNLKEIALFLENSYEFVMLRNELLVGIRMVHIRRCYCWMRGWLPRRGAFRGVNVQKEDKGILPVYRKSHHMQSTLDLSESEGVAGSPKPKALQCT